MAVKAAGINSEDVMVALSRLNNDHVGREFSKEVIRVGSTTSNVLSGDRVCGIARGAFRATLYASLTTLMRIPSRMMYAEAAAFPVAFATAQYGIVHLANLKAGETILIHAVAGAVGRAVIQIAQNKGAILMATVGSKENNY
ncbi:hypothetical protein RRF57_007889 [Xylaria bambusicola]|uniref:Enoyl reductase (ER) domain-containing protein n=1 Tax=Xylaria bambusicola TaxID=326684 RepID=A0AAN7UGW1_9PEZI